jgi:hypothetical protein
MRPFVGFGWELTGWEQCWQAVSRQDTPRPGRRYSPGPPAGRGESGQPYLAKNAVAPEESLAPKGLWVWSACRVQGAAGMRISFFPAAAGPWLPQLYAVRDLGADCRPVTGAALDIQVTA